MDIVISIIVSAMVSVICSRAIAIHTFKVIDGYVKEMIELAKKSIRDTYFNK